MTLLLKRMYERLKAAKEELKETGVLESVAFFEKDDQPALPIPLSLREIGRAKKSYKLIQDFILSFLPDTAIIVCSGWWTPEDGGRGWATHTPGAKQIIMVQGGSPAGVMCLIQDYVKIDSAVGYLGVRQRMIKKSPFFENAWENRAAIELQKAQEEKEEFLRVQQEVELQRTLLLADPSPDEESFLNF